MKTKKMLMMASVAGLMALPFAMPSTAQADDFNIRLNLGGAPYHNQNYVQPQRVVYQQPAPRIVYVQQPNRVVYVSRPAYRERVVVRNDYRRWRGHDNGHHGGWDNNHRTAWR